LEKVLVIGATGLVGSTLLDTNSDKYQLLGTYNNNPKQGLIHLDVTNKKEVSEVIERVSPKIIIDAHVYKNMDLCETQPEKSWNVNVLGSKNVWEVCNKIGAKYIFISTDSVFDGMKSLYTEDDVTSPLNVYGKNKEEMENILKASNSDYIIIRTSSLYGNRSSCGKVSFIQWLNEEIKKGSVIQLINDQYTTPTLVDDLADIILDLCEMNSFGIFNIAGPDCVTKYDFALNICKEFDLDSSILKPISHLKINQIAIRPKRVKLSLNKIYNLIQRYPIDIKNGLKILHSGIIL
jgi:dTDP-4-dehydrorhamnose reductase